MGFFLAASNISIIFMKLRILNIYFECFLVILKFYLKNIQISIFRNKLEIKRKNNQNNEKELEIARKYLTPQIVLEPTPVQSTWRVREVTKAQ